MMDTLYIGLGYKKQQGKGDFTKFLIKHLGDLNIRAVEHQFSGPLKYFVCSVFGASSEDATTGDREGVPPEWVMDTTGCKTWREVLQKIGCDARAMWPGVWINHAFVGNYSLGTREEVVIISDLRFEDELQAIRDHGGYNIHISRPSVESTDAHISENSLDFNDFDVHIRNSGDLDDLSALAFHEACAIKERFIGEGRYQ